MTPRCAHGKYPEERCTKCDQAISDSFMTMVKRAHRKGQQHLDRGMVDQVLDVLRATSPNVEIISGLLEVIAFMGGRLADAGCEIDKDTAARFAAVIVKAKGAINERGTDTGTLPDSTGDPTAAG